MGRVELFVMEMYRYELFGISFESEEAIPGLSEKDWRSPACAPIHIGFGKVPDVIRDPDYEDAAIQANASEYLFTYPGVLRLHMAGDNRIRVEKLEHCDTMRLWTLILGIGFSITGFRRGFVPLHASAVAVNGCCVALAGQSGSGKSTLAASLTDLGFSLHAEDLCLIQPKEEFGYAVGTGIQEFRLSTQAVETLGWINHIPFAGGSELSKVIYRLPSIPSSLLRLRRVYALEFADEENPPDICRMTGVAALQMLIRCLRLRAGLLSVGDQQRTFEQLTSISDKVEIFRFIRPRDHRQMLKWSERLAAHIQS